MIPAKNREWLFTAALVLAGAAGMALIWYTTRWGAGLLDDAFIYITAAQNLAAGRDLAWPWGAGELRPLTYFPPMFSLTLAGFELLGIRAAEAARLVNAAAFGGSLVFAGLLARRAARSTGFALWAVLLLLCSDVLIEAHSWAMSEALYIFLALAGMWLLVVFLEKERRSWLLAAAALLGLAFLTRYLGASLLLAGGLLLLWKRRRLGELLAYSAVSLLPMSLWLLRTMLLIGAPTDRVAGVHLVTLKQAVKALNTLLVWFIPGRFVHGREFIAAGLLAAAIVVIVWLARRNLPADSSPAAGGRGAARALLAMQAAFHVSLLWVSKSFFDPITPLNDRIFSPILPAVIILIAAWLSDLWSAPRRWLKAAVLLAAAGFALFYAARAVDLAPRLHNVGLGLARKGWHSSETLEAVRALPAVPLYSNSPAAIYLWTGRSAYPIDDAAQMRQRMAAEGAVLVFFNSISLDLFDTSLEALTAGLTQVESFQDGALYHRAP